MPWGRHMSKTGRTNNKTPPKRDRIEWIIQYCREHKGSTISTQNPDFFAKYVEANNARTTEAGKQGRPVCQMLLDDLTEMFNSGELGRHKVSRSPSGWYYVYKLLI